MKLIRKIKARKAGVPFVIKNEWYNYMAMNKYGIGVMVNIFDDKRSYIVPKLGKEVEILFRNRDGEKRCKYKITKLIEESRNRDWLYDYDWVNVNLEFTSFVSEKGFDTMVEDLIQLKRESCMKSKNCDVCLWKKDGGYCYEIKDILERIKEQIAN